MHIYIYIYIYVYVLHSSLLFILSNLGPYSISYGPWIGHVHCAFLRNARGDLAINFVAVCVITSPRSRDAVKILEARADAEKRGLIVLAATVVSRNCPWPIMLTSRSSRATCINILNGDLPTPAAFMGVVIAYTCGFYRKTTPEPASAVPRPQLYRGHDSATCISFPTAPPKPVNLDNAVRPSRFRLSLVLRYRR
jgi:hypothetical protein